MRELQNRHRNWSMFFLLLVIFRGGKIGGSGNGSKLKTDSGRAWCPNSEDFKLIISLSSVISKVISLQQLVFMNEKVLYIENRIIAPNSYFHAFTGLQ